MQAAEQEVQLAQAHEGEDVRGEDDERRSG